MRNLSLLFLSFIIAPVAEAETRVFVSLAGTLLEAEITAVAGDSITLKRMSDEQTLVVNRKTLCKEDNAYIANWMEQHPDKAAVPTPAPTNAAAPAQKFSLACQTQPSKSNRGPADGGERTIELAYNFNISNREVRRGLENARGLVIILGKSAAESNGDLIVLQKEEFDVAISAQSKMLHSTTPVRLTYSQGLGTPYGVKSYGYVLIVRDASGNILLVESSPDSSAKFTKELLSLTEVPCIVDRDFKLKSQSTVPTGYISF